MKMIRVKGMRQSIDFGGKRYGPSDKPLDVPLELAGALGLVPVDGAAVATGGEGAGQEADTASQKLVTQLQGNLNLLLDQLKPHAEGQETPDQTLGRLLKGQGEDSFAAERDDLKGQLEAAERRVGEADRLVQGWQERVKEHGDLARNLQTQLDEVAKERDDLKGQLETGKFLPADAFDRLKGIDGIGDKLAQKALDALVAPAKDGK